jgi:hypothetical protein
VTSLRRSSRRRTETGDNIVQIEIPRNVELRLKKLAAAAGFGDDVQRYMLHCSLDAGEEPASAGAMLPRDTWKAEFDALLATLPKRDTHLDDSRESIYRGRGE